MTERTRCRILMRLGAVCWSLVLPAVWVCAAETIAEPDWTSHFVTRVEALALLETLNAELLSHESATLTLEHWCERHRLATPAKVTAQRMMSAEKAPSPEQRRELRVGLAETVRYRRVRLMCGAVLLSEAENWYVPGRLTPAMNRLLDGTDTPFGKAVFALHFQRHNLSSRLLWSPLPDGWEMSLDALPAATEAQALPESVLQHKAVLSLPGGMPISEVVETYKRGVLAFPVTRP